MPDVVRRPTRRARRSFGKREKRRIRREFYGGVIELWDEGFSPEVISKKTGRSLPTVQRLCDALERIDKRKRGEVGEDG